MIVGGAWQGKTAYAERNYPAPYRIVNHYQEVIRSQMQRGEEPLEEVKKLPLTDEGLVIICDEVGCGLVPVDAFERAYREQVGRTGGYLAAQAKQVIRVVCGIGQTIKP